MSLINNIQKVISSTLGRIALADDPGTFTPAGKKRDPKAGRTASDGGFIETATQAKAELNINLVAGMDIDDLNAIDNDDLTITLARGTSYLMAGAWCMEAVPVGNNQAKVTFCSNTSEKVGG